METTCPRTDSPAWRQERLAFRVLKAVYEESGGNCVHSVSTEHVVQAHSLPRSEFDRLLPLLLERGYLFAVEGTHLVCITPKGIRYIQKAAGRRQSLRFRTTDPPLGSISGAALQRR